MARRTRADVVELIADLILDGREDEVLDDLKAGRIDARERRATGVIYYYGW